MKNLIIVSVFLSGIILPGSVNAANGDYQMLAPIPGISQPDGSANIKDFIPGVVKLLIGLAAALAVLTLIFGGIQYMSTDAVSGKSSGRETINNAILGLLLAIGSYTLLNTINPRLLSLNLQLPYVGSDKITEINIDTTDPTNPANEKAWVKGAPWPDDTEIRNFFGQNGMGINHLNCKKVGDTGCTSVYGLSENIKNALLKVHTDCGCYLQVTGGTEFWLHGRGGGTGDGVLYTSQHRPGGTAVDLSLRTPVTAFLKRLPISTNPKQCAPGVERYYYAGGLFVNEIIPGNDPHWHVCFY